MMHGRETWTMKFAEMLKLVRTELMMLTLMRSFRCTYSMLVTIKDDITDCWTAWGIVIVLLKWGRLIQIRHVKGGD